jgi:hypothetical protein
MISLQAMRKSVERILRDQGDFSSGLILNLTVAALPQTDCRRLQKSIFSPPNVRVYGESEAE